MKKVILIITAYIMMLISGTDPVPTESVREASPPVEETVAVVMPERIPEPERETDIPFQPVIETETAKEPEAELPPEIFIPSTPEPEREPESSEEWLPVIIEETVPQPEWEPQISEEPCEEAVEVTVVPEFDVSRHVSWAQSYGTDIGLTLDSTATACWDNPIAAHSGCVYIDRDLRDLLDWYRICGYTQFWVWSEDLGNGNYSIYIGYA